jgi:Tol biopolymer transport system component
MGDSLQGLVAVNVVDGPDATPEILVPGDAFYWFGHPDWSRGGDRIVFTTQEACIKEGACNLEPYTDVYVYDFAIADTLMLTDLASRWLSWSPDDSQLVGTWDRKVHLIDAENGEEVDVLYRRDGRRPDWRRCLPGPGCGPGN